MNEIMSLKEGKNTHLKQIPNANNFSLDPMPE